MADIKGVNNADNPYLNLNPSKTEKAAETQSDMFMKLMIANLRNQDPTSPAETSEFMSQISDMSMVEGIANLNNSMNNFSNSMMSSQTALQASSLIGQTVYVPTTTAQVDANGRVDGVLELPYSSPDVKVTVFDEAGKEVGSFSLGAQAAGDGNFAWNLPAELAGGTYRFEASALGPDNEYEAVQTYLGRNVESVTLGQNGVGMKINIPGGSVSLDQIKQIG
ncbi:flagellar hook capping FlgD N-terminal domain-containing protein [Motiliproteus sediminis]|uniref:flagellar hook capping FlgD N-terminal domain-containing protein n=1 Tax=Motiliproteus sediminis TaxID=1468178 RepID=UPI001AEFE521|nr:flagellar hook capping FlgD N-terminal domain-containing protein [Motiliproteus sediminis]